jgi:chemotaxis signal transduction protein
MTTPTGLSPLPNADPATMRFRERVRARVGMAEMLAFHVGGERFGFDLRAVDEILESLQLQRLPDASLPLAGVCSHDGRTIPVFLPSVPLGVAPPVGTTVLVMRSGTRRVGLLVDDVDEVELVDLSGVRDAPFESTDELLLGILWRNEILTAVLDARAVVAACTVAGDPT